MSGNTWDTLGDLYAFEVRSAVTSGERVPATLLKSGRLVALVREAMALPVEMKETASIQTEAHLYDFREIEAMSADPTFPK